MSHELKAAATLLLLIRRKWFVRQPDRGERRV
jgi:hypothetical protein